MSYWQSIKNSGRPLMLPDIGTYFNQDMQLAESLIDELVAAGVTTIKGEILSNPDICLDAHNSGNEKYWGHQSNQHQEENYRALIERKVVSLDAYQTLFEYAQSQGMDVVVSVYDFEGADFAKKMGCKAIKVASSNITHQPLIEYIAKLELPMIVDTGHSSLEEISRAINWAQDANENHEVDLLVEHSPKGPPASVSEQNLKFMQTMGNAFHLPVGLSDHHAGNEMLLAATAMGALVLEKGVCPDAMGDEQDGGHALPISQVGATLSQINMIADALGDGIRHLERSRDKYVSRMGLVTKQRLTAGAELSLETVSFAFPAKGIKSEYWDEVRGMTLNKNLDIGQVIHWSDVSFKG